jgi:hypothetical protein
MHQSFVTYKSFRWAVWSGVLSVGSIVAYLLNSPRDPPNGGTWLGYTLGTIGALLIVWLMWFGVRKRSFRSGSGSAVGWLSAHVWLGITLILVATLHCGFQFGKNVHTVAYVLMCVVVGSGIWGVYTYIRYPDLMAKQRGNLSRDELFAKLREFDSKALSMASQLDVEIHDTVAEAIRRTHVGGGLWTQLRARDESTILIPRRAKSGGITSRMVDNKGQRSLIEMLAERQAVSTDAAEAARIQSLLEAVGSKAELLRKIQRDIQLQGLLQFWLYFHLPLSFALLAALAIHIITVFLYW